MARQWVGSGAVGYDAEGGEDAGDVHPPLSVKGYEQDTDHACEGKGGIGCCLHGAGGDVAFGDSATRSHAAGFVESGFEVVVFVGEVGCYLGEEGEEHAHEPGDESEPPGEHAERACVHDACKGDGEGAQTHGFKPYLDFS